MLALLTRFLSSGPFMPHGHCYLWKPGLVWLHAVTDALIGLAYLSICISLWQLARRIRLPFHWMFVAFGLFIGACGATHFMELWTLWEPRYWLAGGVKALTAAASIPTAILLVPLAPRVVELVKRANISEERRLKLEETHAELDALYRKVKEMDVVKTQFFSNVSHELRTPLTLILGPVERLLADPTTAAAQRHDLEVVARNARTLLKHVNDLLEVSRLDAGRLGVGYAAVDLARLVRLAAAHFDSVAAERAIELTVDAPAALAAEVDPDKVSRVLLNLLANAFKFTPEGGRVRLHVETPDGPRGAAVISVCDSGPGVEPALREAIFERFRQGDGSITRSTRGTGLGLAIARDFVALHRGSIRVDKAAEGGARFVVELPLAAPAGAQVRPPDGPGESSFTTETARALVEELEARVEAEARPTPTVVDDGRPRVLVVEDNDEMRQFIVEALASEYQVVTAADGLQGLDRAVALRPDAVVTDVMMPRMSGDVLVKEIRLRPELEGTPVVMLTAKADDGLRARLLREGAQDYVMKPFSATELRARLGNLVSVKRARDFLRAELRSQIDDVEALAREVAHQRRELQTSLDAVRAARERAERAGKVRGLFLGLVSHELRTPVTAMLLHADLLRRDVQGLSPRQLQITERMNAALKRLLELIDTTLEYTRAESGRVSIHTEPVDAPAIARSVVEDLGPAAREKSLALSVSAPPDLPPVQTDPRLLRVVLVHLLGNAVRHTEQGRVVVTVGREGEALRVDVADTGPGIAPEHHGAIFEPFTHLEPLRNKHKPGLGLGLALVRELVEALGGSIELASAPGQGSTFTVRLPPYAGASEPAAPAADPVA